MKSFHVYLFKPNSFLIFDFCGSSYWMKSSLLSQIIYDLIWKSEKLLQRNCQFTCKCNYDSNKTFLFCLLSDFRKSLQKWYLAKQTALPRRLASQNTPRGLIPTGLLLQEGTSFTPWQGPSGKGPISQFHIYTFNQRMLSSQIASLPVVLSAGPLGNQGVIRLVNKALDPFQYFKKPEIRV